MFNLLIKIWYWLFPATITFVSGEKIRMPRNRSLWQALGLPKEE